MQRPLLRRIQPKNQLESQVNEFKLQKLAEDIVDFKQNTEVRLDSAIEKVNTVADDAKDTLSELKTLPKKVQKDFEELTNEVVDALKEIKAGGLKGDPGDSPDEEAMEKRLLAKIPKIDVNKIAEKASSLVKPTPASLKIIKESVELKDEEIVPKLNKASNLGDLSLSMSNIKDWDKKMSDIKTEISRNKGGYHGGGFNNIASASQVVSTGLDTLKFTGSGVSSVTQTGRTVTVDIAGGGGSGTVTNVATAGLISGGPITTTGTITTSMATGKLVGRSTAGTGVMEEITVGSGLTLSGGTLTATGGGTGDVVGPASATDTAVALFDGTTGKLIKNSTVTINTIGQASGLNRLTATTNFSLQTGTTASANGYNIALTAGSVASGNGDGGNVVLTPGLKSGTGTNGYIKMFGSSGLFSANFTAGSLTADRIITIPDAAGTLTFGTGTTNQLTYWVDANTIGALTTATYPSLTELSYVKGVTSSIQTQLNAKGAGTVTSVSFTGGLISVATATTTPAFTVAGTSGGVPYFSSASTWATSAALAANAIVIGGGAGAAPATTTTGTGVLTALGVNVGSAGAFVVNGGALGTPSSGTVTNLTGTASININGTVGATTPAAGTFTTGTVNTSLTMVDAANIILNTTTGTKIGTATTQKLAFFNSTPIIQPTGSVITALQNLGLGASLTIPASTVTSGAALTKTDDTNVTLTLGGSPTTALLAASSLTLGWTGTLAVARGGTGGGSASITLFNNITGYTASGATGTTSTNLVFSTSPSITTPTFVTNATVPLLIGGTGTTSTLTYKTTTGVGTTGADHIFVGGNNGGTELMRILNGGSVGVNTPSPAAIGTCFNVYGNAGSVSTVAIEGDNASKFLVAYSGSSSDNAALYFKNSLRLGIATAKDATGFTAIATVDSTGLSLGTSLALTTGTIELGNASDTTISRSAAGVIAVEGVVIPSVSSTNTLTNKRVTKRVVTVNAPGATPTTNTDNCDIAAFTGLAAAITSMTTNLSGTPVNGDMLMFQFTDNGTARAITWGATFASTTSYTLPTTTVISTLLRVLVQWNSTTSKWECIGTA